MSATPPRLLAIAARMSTVGDGRRSPSSSAPPILASCRKRSAAASFNAARAGVVRGAAVSLSVGSRRRCRRRSGRLRDRRRRIRDLSVTFLDRRTASYTAILDDRGDVAAALATWPSMIRSSSSRWAVAPRATAAAGARRTAPRRQPARRRDRSAPCASGWEACLRHRHIPRQGGPLRRPSRGCIVLSLSEPSRGGGARRRRFSRDAAAHARPHGFGGLSSTRGADPVLALDHDRIFEIAPPEIASVADSPVPAMRWPGPRSRHSHSARLRSPGPSRRRCSRHACSPGRDRGARTSRRRHFREALASVPILPRHRRTEDQFHMSPSPSAPLVVHPEVAARACRRQAVWHSRAPSSRMECHGRRTQRWRRASKRSSERAAAVPRRSRSSTGCCASASTRPSAMLWPRHRTMKRRAPISPTRCPSAAPAARRSQPP